MRRARGDGVIAGGSACDPGGIIDKLEQYRKETGNVIGKGVNRDAAEIVRKGR
jgi:hypothetical protein